MKKSILTFFLLSFALTIIAQQKLSYAYDDAGNRVNRTIVLSNKSAAVTKAETASEYFEETIAEKQVKIYPNPVQSELTLSVSGFGDATATGEYMLYRFDGSMVSRGKVVSEKTTVDMSQLKNGNYIMRIVIDGKQSSWKIIKE